MPELIGSIKIDPTRSVPDIAPAPTIDEPNPPMTRKSLSILAALLPPVLAATPASLHAQAAPAESAPAPTPVQQVDVRVSADAQRRADVAGRQVVTRDELLRHGDASLADALRRVPGLSVGGRGQATELKLGGLGDGHTQVLLNGEPVPRDFALDNLPLDSLERVEITRGASVQNAQAIAGSINLITRKATALATRELKLSAGRQWGRPQSAATLNLGDRVGAATWGLGLTASSEHLLWPDTEEESQRDGLTGTVTQRSLTAKRESDNTRAISANPRLSWKHEDAADGRAGEGAGAGAGAGGSWQLSTDHSLRHAISGGGVADRREALDGPPPAQAVSDLDLNYQRWFWRGRTQAQRVEADGSRTELRLNLTWSRRDQHSRLQAWDSLPQAVLDETVTGRATDRSAVLNLNHQRPLGDAHRLDLGAELEQARRSESRVQTDQPLPAGLPPEDQDERYDARTRRRALYAQDDWTLGRRTEAQLGLRVEQLDTDSAGNVFTEVVQAHRLVGPVMRLSSTPEGTQDTWKLGLSRGFKLPAPRDVMPRRYAPIDVSPTTPAMTGNPDLRPERAWSLDGSWSRPVPAWAGDLVLSAAWRRIEDVILDRLIAQPLDLRTPWLLQRFNAGAAWAANLEASLHGEAKGLISDAAPLRWQGSLSLNRSRLLDVDGAHPALPGQAPWQLKLGAGQRLGAWTANLGLEAQGAAVADLPTGRRQGVNARHAATADLAWQPRPRLTWRLAATQAWASDEVDTREVRVIEGGQPQVYTGRDAWHRQAALRLSVDWGF